MAELEALTRDPRAITERLTELASTCHLVSRFTNVDTELPPGFEVSVTFVTFDAAGHDVIESTMKDGKLVLSAKAMQEIGAAAGIDWSSSESGRRDTIGHPHYVEYRAAGFVRGIDGQPAQVIGDVVLDARDGSELIAEILQREAEAGRDAFLKVRETRKFLLRSAETQAQARAVASAFGLVREYEPSELSKPFAVVRVLFTGATEDPALAEKFALMRAEQAVGLFVDRMATLPNPFASPKRAARFLVAITGDTHGDEAENGKLEEHDRIMEFIGAESAARGVSLFLHSGDVYERGTTLLERQRVAGWVTYWGSHAPVVVIPGNHDEDREIAMIGRLRARFPIRGVTAPTVIEEAGAAIACLPWPRKASFLARLGAVGRVEGDVAATRALVEVLRKLGDDLQRCTGPRLFLGHAMVRGSRTCLGQPPLVGADFELGLDDLALVRASFYALGHIHLAQEWDVAGAPAAYPGSPYRRNFGEQNPKSFIIAEYEGPKLVGWERVPTPATEMVDASGAFDGSALRVAVPESVRGAEVRLSYSAAVDQQETARARAEEMRDRMLAEGAVSVKLEAEVLVEKRARAPEVAAAATLEKMAEAHWASIGFDPGERRGALLEKLSWLAERAKEAA